MATAAERGGLLGRVKSLDAILATAEKKGLHRSLGAFQLTLLGIGAVIGTGIFVLTAEAAQKAGPAMMISFVIAGFVCAVAALCYSELASMVPVAGSAYTYTYAVMGELFAWMVGWALILEYAIGASAVAVGWSGYFVGLMKSWGIIIPPALAAGPFGGGVFNLPAAVIAGLVTVLLIVGTKESARFNAVLVLVKITALTVFCILTLPILKGEHFTPFIPNGWGTYGVVGAAASIFFAYVGFDAVSTAAEETKNPQRNVPIGLIGSLGICTIFYLLVAAGAIGAIGAQPVRDALGHPFPPGSIELTNQCNAIVAGGAHAAARLLARGAGACASQRRLSAPWRLDGHCRVHRAAVGRADDDVRPDPHLLRHGARRPASGEARVGAPALPHAARRDRSHRRRRDAGRGLPAGRQARRLFQLGHAVRLHDGGDLGAGASPDRSEPQASVPHAGGRDHRADRHHRLHRALCHAAADRDRWCFRCGAPSAC